mmetsp:Transcript_25336/g.69670  ORF Transcript_25336/g.69670 Transcript_25336/m.69670 type:complete len:1084 (-) Transcript_25336:277-3528(-)
MEALEDLLSDTDCDGFVDNTSVLGTAVGSHSRISFAALRKGLDGQAPPLAPFDEDDNLGFRSGSAGSVRSREDDADIHDNVEEASLQKMWDVTTFGLQGSKEARSLTDDRGRDPGLAVECWTDSVIAGNSSWPQPTWNPAWLPAADRVAVEEEEEEEEDYDEPLSLRRTQPRLQHQLPPSSQLVEEQADPWSIMEATGQWDRDDCATGNGKIGLGKPAKHEPEEGPFQSGASLPRAMTSVQTTADGGASTPTSSEGNSGVGAGPSPHSTPRSPFSAGTGHGLFEDELCAHSALVSKSVNTLRVSGLENSPANGNHISKDGSSNGTRGGIVRDSPEGIEEHSLCGEPPCGFPSRDAEEDIGNAEEASILVSSNYTEGGSASSGAVPGVQTIAATVSCDPAAAEANGDSLIAWCTASARTNPGPKPHPFLKKGARMPRSDLPRSGTGPSPTKPISNPVAKKPPRLQLRASSEPTPPRRTTSHDAFSSAFLPEEEAKGDLHDDTIAGLMNDNAPHQVSPTGGVYETTFGEGGDGFMARTTQQAELMGDCKVPHPHTVRSSLPQLGCGEDGVVDAWGDSVPWDCRGIDVELELNLDECLSSSRQTGSSAGEPPTSQVVKSYFHGSCSSSSRQKSAAIPERLSGSQPPSQRQAGCPSRRKQQEGLGTYAAIYGSTAPAAEGSADKALDSLHAGEAASQGFGVAKVEQETRQRLMALEQQMKSCEREREDLKKLQAQAEQSERDLSRERQKLWREVESERRALHAEFDAERAALRKEKRRIGQGAERQRQQLAEDREMLEERRRLQDRTEQLEEEMREKEKRWQRTVDRLQRQISDLTKKNQELQDEVRRANQQAHQAQHGVAWNELPRRSASATSARGRRQSISKCTTKAACSLVREAPVAGGAAAFVAAAAAAVVAPAPTASAQCCYPGVSKDGTPTAAVGSTASDAQRSLPTQEVQEVRNLDGRTERIFVDGRREVEFANGLRKIMWPDGHSSVLFQNGDKKEIHPDGVIVYHYSATGAVQTTLPDGSDLYHFSDGQFEQHNPDGSKEIRFPNGTSKRVFPDGSEEVCFVDGTVRRTPSTTKPGIR